jgi:Ca-activated chloride channel family protein
MRMKKIVLAAILLAVVAGWLAAQDTEEPTTPAGATGSAVVATKPIKVRVDLVNVLFTVTDKKNRLVLDLTKDDVRVFEDKQPQSIRFFSRESDLPLRIGILIDTSNSIRERLRFEQEAAIDFLNATVRPGKDQAYVLAFDVEPQLLQDYTDNTEKLSKAIRGLRAGGGTGLYDAIYSAAKEKMLFFPPPEPYLRRVMIVVSDGLDNQSEHTREEALAMAQRGEVTIFAISTNRTGLAQRGDKVLKYLAEETGGRAFFPFSASDLGSDFQAISRELRSQYSLAYISTNTAHDGTFRAITIQSKDKAIRVRAKSGYFAPSQ